MSFFKKYLDITKKNHSFVCVGLDSDITKIPSFLNRENNPIYSFNKEIIDATKDVTACYKPNFAFYLSAGKKGFEALEKTIAYIPSEIPVILDVKVGDIGNTMKHYAKAFFEELAVDSITVNPLMGSDVIDPLLEYPDKMKFLLVLTSNKSANDYLKREQLFKVIGEMVLKSDSKQIGAVVGGTNSKELKEIRELMPESIFLVPGIGAQGGNLEVVMNNAISSKDNPLLLINSSRGIIFASSEKDFAEASRKATISLKNSINNCL